MKYYCSILHTVKKKLFALTSTLSAHIRLYIAPCILENSVHKKICLYLKSHMQSFTIIDMHKTKTDRFYTQFILLMTKSLHNIYLSHKCKNHAHNNHLPQDDKISTYSHSPFCT